MKYSIVVPCYNEEKNINSLAERFKTVAESYEIELLLVDNGSKDNTQNEIDRAVAKYPFIKKVVVEVNQGYGNGILSGLSEAKGKCLGWIHADLQSDPLVFMDMFEAAEKEKVCFLYKGARKDRSVSDLLFTKGMAVFESALFGAKMNDVNSQPTLLSRSFYEQWNDPPKDFSLDLYAYALALKNNISISRFDSPQSKRLNGESTWNTAWNSRYKMVKRVIAYSFDVKERLKEEQHG